MVVGQQQKTDRAENVGEQQPSPPSLRHHQTLASVVEAMDEMDHVGGGESTMDGKLKCVQQFELQNPENEEALLTPIAREQRLMSKYRWLRYALLVSFSFFTLMDIVKADAFYATLLDMVLPTAPENRTAKQISSILVANEVSMAAIQMIAIGLLEQYFLPSVWCSINFIATVVGWVAFDTPHLTTGRFVLVYFLRAVNVRYSTVVHWLGDRYCSYTMAVQFFISLLPYIVKLPLFHYYRHIAVFGLQPEFLLCAVMAFVLFFCTLSTYSSKHETESQQPHPRRCRMQSSQPSSLPPTNPDKSGTWMCNLACTLFLAGVYYDFPVFTTFAVVYLGYDITYDMVYIHVGLYVTVFTVNIAYNLFKTVHRRYLIKVQEYSDYDVAVSSNRARFLFAAISYASVIVSRAAFLALQLTEYRSAALLTVCICLGGLGGNVQPLLAELMFRQRREGLPRHHRSMFWPHRRSIYSNGSSRTKLQKLRDFWSDHSDQAFKWFYVDGKSVVNLLLLLLWISVYGFAGSWWFTANTIVLLSVSAILFIRYYRVYVHE